MTSGAANADHRRARRVRRGRRLVGAPRGVAAAFVRAPRLHLDVTVGLNDGSGSSAQEIPYYAGAFGSALLTNDVDAAEAIIFLAGTNVGAAVFETGLAHLTRRGLAWRSRRAVRPLPAVPGSAR